MKKAIFITGSTKGIGKAIAIEAMKSGFFVYLNYAHDDHAAELCEKELNDNGYSQNFKIIKADVSKFESIETIIRLISQQEYPLHGLVLNSSSNGKTRNSFLDITPAELEDMFRINLFAPFFLVQKMANIICDQGAVVFIGSNVGIYPHSTYIPYGLTKSSEIFLAKMLVKEFSHRRITVNAVAPAFIETDMFPGNRSEEHLSNIKKKVAVHRFGQAEEVAQAVLCLLTNSYINGSVVPVDGGYDFE